MLNTTTRVMFVLGAISLGSLVAKGELPEHEVERVLDNAQDNRPQIEHALATVRADQREGLEFLLRHMPPTDLQSLSADYLLENIEYAYLARSESAWGSQIPDEVFLNDVLPYANINERRDRWRKDFYNRFQPLVTDIDVPSQAAARLNQLIFPQLNVKYSRRRGKADQSPYESIESGLASCTGLSILLIDACRAVGIPARFVGTPLWSDGSGNHSWVEIWDDGWHFTGAAEPSGDDLDQAWFVERAATAQRDAPPHAIYAVSFRHTPLRFPLVWNRSIDFVRAVNVTDRYANLGESLPAGHSAIMIRVIDPNSRDRCAANVRVKDQKGKIVYQGQSKDERFDGNDHLTIPLPQYEFFEVEVLHEDHVMRTPIRTTVGSQLVTINVPRDVAVSSPNVPRDVAVSSPTPSADVRSRDAVQSLEEYLKQADDQRVAISEQPFATVALTRSDAVQSSELLWEDHLNTLRRTRRTEMEQRELQLDQWRLRFDYTTFGEAPADGRRLFISLHGGGNTSPSANDRQWENQKRLYEPSEGVYLSPRAPSNTWDLWHRDHIDPMFDRLIEDLIAFENVHPNRVYLMGYSAGGDGVYQLAPRMADRFAAAAMMAGHPNETIPLGLRNLPFTLHMGQRDGAYQRNQVAQEWGRQLDELQRADVEGYVHWVKIHEGKGHWMDGEDAEAIGWMSQYQCDPLPSRVVWHQDDVTHTRYYWLAVAASDARPRTTIVAQVTGQRIDIDSTDVGSITVRLHDQLVDLDQPVEIWSGGKQIYSGEVQRTIATQAMSLRERGNSSTLFSTELQVAVPVSEASSL